MIERRSLLKGSMAALAVLSCSSGRLFGSPHEAEAFSQARFEALKGTWFEVEADGIRTRIQLVEIYPCVATPDLEQFSLVMRGTDAEIKEGIHRVVPGDGAAFEIHLRPAGELDRGPYFTASFSHRRPTTAG